MTANRQFYLPKGKTEVIILHPFKVLIVKPGWCGGRPFSSPRAPIAFRHDAHSDVGVSTRHPVTNRPRSVHSFRAAVS